MLTHMMSHMILVINGFGSHTDYHFVLGSDWGFGSLNDSHTGSQTF